MPNRRSLFYSALPKHGYNVNAIGHNNKPRHAYVYLSMMKKAIARILCCIYAFIILAMASATFVEKALGHAAAFKHIYNSWIFAGAWAILATISTYIIVKKRQSMRRAAFMIHVALIAVLAAAGITKICGEQGIMHIAPGYDASAFITDNGDNRTLPFSLSINDISADHTLQRDGYRFILAGQHGRDAVVIVNHDPWGLPATYAAYALLLASSCVFLAKWRAHRRLVAITLAAWLAALAVCEIYKHTHQLIPALDSGWFSIHVSLIVVAFGLIIAAMVAGIAGLITMRGGNHALSGRLAEKERALICPAVLMLAAGIFIGAIWAGDSWGRYWGWDPKETWALITMMAYAVPLHSTLLPPLQKPRNMHIFCIAASPTVAITYFGVNMLLGGLHSYA